MWLRLKEFPAKTWRFNDKDVLSLRKRAPIEIRADNGIVSFLFRNKEIGILGFEDLEMPGQCLIDEDKKIIFCTKKKGFIFLPDYYKKYCSEISTKRDTFVPTAPPNY
jgi:hypothetical protein